MKKLKCISLLLLMGLAPCSADSFSDGVASPKVSIEADQATADEAQAWGDNYILDKYFFRDNWFYSFHVGSFVNWGTNLKDFGLYRFRLSVGVSVGKWFYPQVGMRAQLLYGGNRGETTDGHRSYHSHTAELACDGLLNLTNVFSRYREERRFNLLFVLGVGADQTFGFSKRDWNANEMQFERDNCTLLSFRTGLMALYQISKKWDLSFEVINNWLDDSYDGIISNNRWDGHVNANIGIVRRLMNHDGGYKFKYIDRDWAKFDDANKEINRLRDEAERLRNQPRKQLVGGRQVNTLVSFADTADVIDAMQEVNVFTAVQAMRQNDHKVNLYITTLSHMSADAFQKRADVIHQSLISQYGIPASRIIIEKDAAAVEKQNKMDGSVIIYINESKTK